MDYIIEKAAVSDAAEISEVTKRAFSLYQEELHLNWVVSALKENVDAVVSDIENHTVYVAKSADGKVLGSIRCRQLSDELAYIYRFGVDTSISSTGIGSGLLGAVIDEYTQKGYKALALHTNSKYYKLARYYYGKQFFVHSTNDSKGYIRALFIKELTDGSSYDISPAINI